jgi:hypothetical protein
MTYSWDRLLIDPLPGPRTVNDFTGLQNVAPNVNEVLATTRPNPPAGSSLPRLAAELPARLVLIDPSGGAAGMAAQIAATATTFKADRLILVDVGGDALTDGTEPGLRSPLADQLAIAACLRSGIPSRLLIAAPGVDGEIDPAVLTDRLRDLRAHRIPDLTAPDLAPVLRVFCWHPSEASGLLAAAASGTRGTVEVRDAGDHIALTDDTPSIHLLDADRLPPPSLSRALVSTRTLQEAEAAVIRATGISELQYEAAKAATRHNNNGRLVTVDDLPAIARHAHEAATRGADYISIRRLAELIGLTTLDAFVALIDLITQHRPRHHAPSLYAVQPLPPLPDARSSFDR